MEGHAKAVLQFAIPSIHDGTILDCRVYHPTALQLASSHTGPPRSRHAAILAHPYAPMGGCFDDPVVLAVGGQLLQRGYLLGLFNFRGAGCSAGRTSWTARPEQDDYASFIGFMIHYVHSLEQSQPLSLLLMGGYSYGAMITTHMPPLSHLLEAFRSPPPGSHAEQIRLRAKAMAAGERHQNSDPRPPQRHQPSADADELLIPRPAYLLISPPAPGGLIANLTTLSLSLSHALTKPLRRAAAPEEPIGEGGAEAKLVSNRALAVYGGEDALVSVGKLRAWAGRLRGRGGSLFEAEEIASAGHFWSEEGVLYRLLRAVDGFAQRLQDEG